MQDLKIIPKAASITIRMSQAEAESIQKEAAAQLLSISSYLRRELFLTPLKATI